MRIDSSHPLAARATSAVKPPSTPNMRCTLVSIPSARAWVARATDFGFRFELPLPPSNNDLVRPVLHGMKGGKPMMSLAKTKTAREWLKQVEPVLAGLHARGYEPLRGPVVWWLTSYVSNIARDCSNGAKQLEDAMKGFAWFDDLQVVECHMKKVICAAGEQRAVLEVQPVECDAETAKRVYKSKAGGGRQSA